MDKKEEKNTPNKKDKERETQRLSERAWLDESQKMEYDYDKFSHLKEIASRFIENDTHFMAPVGTVHSGSGDIYITNVGKTESMTLALERVLSSSIDEISSVYVFPGTVYKNARNVLREKHLLVLWGQMHWGKQTTAVKLLEEVANRNIFEISPTVDIEKLSSCELITDRGYIIDTLTPENCKKLSSFLLKLLSNRLCSGRNYLIITADQSVSLSQQTLKVYLVIWNRLPNPNELLQKYLYHYLSGSSYLVTKTIEISQSEKVQKLISNSTLPRQVNRLAKLLSQVSRGELELESALSRYETLAKQQVAEWFGAHNDLEDRTFILSVAVLSGTNYQAIIDADEHLQALLKPKKIDNIEGHEYRKIFGNTRTEQIAKIGAHLLEKEEQTEFGLNSIKSIEFDNPTFQQVILSYVWNEYDRLHKPLVEWLRNLCLHQTFDVRARVAAAIGEFSKYDFGFIRKEVFLFWAKHDEEQIRAAAALALGVAAWNEKLAPQVLALLKHWSTLHDNWHLCWTAAEAYGSFAGLRFPDTALHNLHTIVKAEDLQLLGVLTRSIINLFAAVPENYFDVLNALNSWSIDLSNKTQRIRKLIILLIFLRLCGASKTENGFANGKIPTVLWLLTKDVECKKKILSLFTHALNFKPIRMATLALLQQWSLETDKNDELLPYLMTFFTSLVNRGSDRDVGRLLFCLKQWGSHPQKPSETANKIQLELKEILDRK